MDRGLPALSRRRVVVAGFLTVAVAGLGAGMLFPGVESPGTGAPDATAQIPPGRDRGDAAIGASGLPTTVYEENVGQTDPAVRFVSRRPGYTLFVTDDEAVLSLAQKDDAAPAAVVRQRLIGARPAASTKGLDPRPGGSSYIKGPDPSRWVHAAPHFARVVQTDVYAGVDLVWHGGTGGAEYDFVVAPGSSPDVIGVAFDGPRAVSALADGSLAIETAGGTLSHHAPVAYQEFGDERRTVACSFDLRDDGSVGFDVGPYDATVALVIDPFVDFATFLGGSSHDHATSVVKRPYGETFVAGYTSSLDFPDPAGGTISTGGDFDAFVVRYDALGGSNAFLFGGSLDDRAYGVFADKDEVWICGETQSEDLPTTGGAVQSSLDAEVDGFFAGFTHGGGLTYGSYLGGTWNDVATEIQIAEDGHVVVGGRTISDNFPVVAATQPTHGGSRGAFDVFVSRLNVARTALDFSTFYGGEGNDRLYDLEVAPSGEITICGYTNSNYLPTTSGAFQETNFTFSNGFVARLDPSVPDVLYSTYLGGYGWSWCNDVAVDAAGAAYVTGYTDNIDFPTTPDAYQGARSDVWADAFVTKLSPDGSSLEYSTYLGGRGLDTGNGIWVRSSGEAVVVGATASAEFPVTESADSRVYHGGTWLYDVRGDAFVARLSDDGTALEYGQFLGSCEFDSAYATSPIRILPSDTVPVPVANAGFESPVLASPFFTIGSASSWEVTGAAGQFAPSSYGVFNGGQVTDDQTAYCDSGSIRQVLDHTLLPLARYTVTVDVLDRNDADIVGYEIRLLAGTDPYGDGVTDWNGGTTITALAGVDESSGGLPADGDALTVTFTFDTSWSTPEIGRTLGIELSGDGSQVGFDAVRVTVEPLPSDDLFDVVGDTASSDFPTVAPIQGTFGGVHDAFLASFDLPDGNDTDIEPVAPHDLRVSVLGSTAVELTWSHDIPTLESRTSSTVTDIVIQRADLPGFTFNTIATLPIAGFTATGEQTYVDGSVFSTSGYHYRVLAAGTHACDFPSSAIALQTLPHLAPMPPVPLLQRPESPLAPVNVIAAQADPRTFVVAWEPGVADPGGGYEVFRREGAGDLVGAGISRAGDPQLTDQSDVREPDVTYVVRALGGEDDQVVSAPYTVFRSESLGVGIVRGRVSDTTRARRDSFRAVGMLAVDDVAFDPRGDSARLVFGSAAAPFAIDIPAGDRGWRAKRGRWIWDSRKSAVAGVGRVTLTLDAGHGRFRLNAAHFDFPGDQSTGVVGVGLRLGPTVGGDQREFASGRGRTRKLRK